MAAMAASCHPEAEAKRPALPESTIRSVLLDMHLADAAVDKQGGSFEGRNLTRDALYEQILAQQGLRRSEFDSAYRYYLQDPARLDSLYTRMLRQLDTLIAEQQKYQATQTPFGTPAASPPAGAILRP
jgi:hypothetical protein